MTFEERRLAEALAELGARYGLAAASASTDTFTVTVSEPPLETRLPLDDYKAPLYGYDVETRRHEI